MTMIRRLKSIGRDQRGAAAVELALIAPILAMVLVISFAVWQQMAAHQQLRETLNTGAEYYMNGGVDDAYAETLMLNVWEDRPDDSAVDATRACFCGATATSCSSLCAGSTQTSVYVNLSAEAPHTFLTSETTLSEARSVRVR